LKSEPPTLPLEETSGSPILHRALFSLSLQKKFPTLFPREMSKADILSPLPLPWLESTNWHWQSLEPSFPGWFLH